MQTFHVSFNLVLNDDASPRKWLISAIEDLLEEGESIEDFGFVELFDTDLDQ